MRMMIPVTAVQELQLPEEDIPCREKYAQYQLWDRKNLRGKYTSMYGSYEEEKELKAIFEKTFGPCEIEEI